MDRNNYQKLYELETTPEALEEASQYIAGNLKPFLSTLEPVLICFPDKGPASLGSVFKRAVELCGAIAIVWGPDFRWQELLRLAFDSHANTVIAHPLVALGLVKLAKATSTPLYIYDLVFGGYPYARWMIEGVKRGLDCRVWGCYAAKCSPIIAGFTCDREAGIHTRDDVFDLQVFDDDGQRIYYPKRGRIRFASKRNPEVVYDPEETAIVHYQPCSCGCDSPRIVETLQVDSIPAYVLLEERFLEWSSILDFRATNTESGLKLELVVFPDSALPKLPSCAQLIIRQWDPETDIPFFMEDNYLKKAEKSL